MKLRCPVIILAAKSHESISETENIINHFNLLNTSITVCSEYQDENRLYVGHFVLNESKLNYGTKRSKREFSNFRTVILGHQHDFQFIPPNIYQIGSIRYIDFGEDENIPKKVAICQNYKEKNEKWQFLTLNSPIPMKNIELGQNDQKPTILDPIQGDSKQENGKESGILGVKSGLNEVLAQLDNLPIKTKVRVIFKDYNLYREFLPYYQKYEDKFVLFKDKKEFILNLEIASTKKENISLKESLNKFLEINKIPEEIKKILLEELK